MLKKIVLFSLPFVFTVAAEGAFQEDSLIGFGDQVYVVDDNNQLSIPFTFGRSGEVIGLGEVFDSKNNASGPLFISSVLVQFDDNSEQIYNGSNVSDIYVSEGCLPTDPMKTARSEVCVSEEEVFIDIHLPSLFGDPLITFSGNPKARVLAVNRSTNSIMVEFLTSEASILSQGRPVVYSVNDLTKGPTLSYDDL